MAQTILSALAPIVFTLLLGFVAAWRRDWRPNLNPSLSTPETTTLLMLDLIKQTCNQERRPQAS